MRQPSRDDLGLTAGTSTDGFIPVWRKSTKSIGNGQCIEAAVLADGFLAVRDSKNKSGPALFLDTGEWHTFITEIKNGRYDNF
jgi:hypothetical protein